MNTSTSAREAMAAKLRALPPGYVLPPDGAKSDSISYKADSTSYPSYPVTSGGFSASPHLKEEGKEVTTEVTTTSYLSPENGPEGDVLANLNALLARLLGYAVRLRCEDPPKGTRAQALTYQAQQIEKLAARSVNAGGTEDGWPDPSDPFADGDQIAGLRVDLADLTREDAPYPLGQLPSEPFSADPPRYFSGQLIGGARK